MRQVVLILLLLAACSSPRSTERMVVIELVLAETEYHDEYRVVEAEGSGEKFFLHRKVLLNSDDIESAAVSERMDLPAVEIVFTEAGGQKLATVTEHNKGKRLAILIDGRLVMAPHIMETITDGRAVISGITKEEAERIAAAF